MVEKYHRKRLIFLNLKYQHFLRQLEGLLNLIVSLTWFVEAPATFSDATCQSGVFGVRRSA